METALPNARYERKFVVDGLPLPEVLALVRRHPAAFRQAYPPRTVNNIYLDSPGLGEYHAHVNGAPNRCKTRVRWYGEFAGEACGPALERKLKRGLVSGKDSHRLPPLRMNGAAARSCLEALFDQAKLPEVLRLALRHLEPTLLNSYLRHYFVSGDGHFRLTVDSDLKFALVQRGLGAALVGFLRARALVIELKFPPEHAGSAERISNFLPFRVGRCSKYVMGIERVGGA